jgi:hypothetical protein
MNAVEQLKSVLCDPDGKCCIAGSDEDRAIVDRALLALAAPVQEPEQEPVTVAIEHCLAARNERTACPHTVSTPAAVMADLKWAVSELEELDDATVHVVSDVLRRHLVAGSFTPAAQSELVQKPDAFALRTKKHGLEFNSGYGMVKTLEQAQEMQRRHMGNLEIVELRATPTAAAHVQEPYARIYETEGPFGLHQSLDCRPYNGRTPDRVVPVYTALPAAAQRQWTGLTDKQMVDAIEPLYQNRATAEVAAVFSMDEFQAIEAKLKEINT